MYHSMTQGTSYATMTLTFGFDLDLLGDLNSKVKARGISSIRQLEAYGHWSFFFFRQPFPDDNSRML